MTGVTFVVTTSGLISDMRFVSFEAKCSCGWRLTATVYESIPEVRDVGEQHRAVCIG